MLKRMIALTLAMLLCIALLGGCGQKKAVEQTEEAVVVSQDGNYEFHGTAKGLAWITPAGSDEKLLEGSIKIREENSAITITLEGDIMTMVESPAWVVFTYPVNGTDQTFAIHRRQLLEALGTTGVILNTAAGGTGFASGLLFWNNGTVQTMILKIQSTHNYSYSPEEGLKIETTPEQLDNYGNLWVESYNEAEGIYTIGYDLTVPMPPFMPNPGTFTLTDEQLQAAFGENPVYTPPAPAAGSDEPAGDASGEADTASGETADATGEADAASGEAGDASGEAEAPSDEAGVPSDETGSEIEPAA